MTPAPELEGAPMGLPLPPQEDAGSPTPPGGEEALMGPGAQRALVALYVATTLSSVIGNVVVIVVFSVGKRSRTDLTGNFN